MSTARRSLKNDDMLCPHGGHSLSPLHAGVYRCNEHGITVVRKPPWSLIGLAPARLEGMTLAQALSQAAD
ncbi:hypothetical protein ACWCZ5_04115 [Streptomyces sp. NPDC001667]